MKPAPGRILSNRNNKNESLFLSNCSKDGKIHIKNVVNLFQLNESFFNDKTKEHVV